MPTGQTQRRFGPRKKALEPYSIKDIREMLNPATRGTKIKNHKMISGHLFIEIEYVRKVERTDRWAYVRNYLVLGEDPHEAGCVAAMYLTDGPNPLAWTTHMRSVSDTRGGVPEVAWCSSLQLRGLTKSGRPSKSYTAHLSTRRKYCKRLVRILDDHLAFNNQNWQAIEQEIDRHKRLLPATYRRPKRNSVGPVGDDDTDHDDENPGADSDDDYSWRDDLDPLNRPESADPDLDHQDNVPDDDQEVVDLDDIDDDILEDDITATNQNRFDPYGNRSPSLTFVPRSRDSSPEIITAHTPDDDIDMVSNPTRNNSDLDDDLVIISESSKRPKLELKIEPSLEVPTTNRITTLRSMDNVIDLTEEPDTTDESARSGKYSMEMIDLTADGDPVINRSSSGIELIELED